MSQEAIDILNTIFEELEAIFPSFAQIHSNQEKLDAMKRVWMRGLIDAGINSRSQIDYALRQCRNSTSPFIPSLGQFLDWCKPTNASLGLPDFHEAYAIAIRLNRQFAEPANLPEHIETVIRHCIQQIDPFKFRQMPDKQAQKVFTHYYAVACDQFRMGTLKPMNRAIEKDVPKPPSQRGPDNPVYKQEMEKIRSILNMGPREEKSAQSAQPRESPASSQGKISPGMPQSAAQIAGKLVLELERKES